EAALVALTFVLVYVHVLRETEGSPITAFLLAVAAAIVSCGFFEPRPHLWTYLFLAITIVILQRARQDASRRNHAWLLAVVYFVWSNLHAGAVVGLAMIAAFALGDFLASRRSSAEQEALLARAKFTAMLALGCIAATFVNPYGWRIYENLLSTISSDTAMNLVLEWASPDFHSKSGKILELFLGVIIYSIAFTTRKRDPGSLIVLALLVYASLSAARNAPLLAVVGSMLIGAELQSAIERHIPNRKHSESYFFGKTPNAAIVTAAVLGIAVLAGTKIGASVRGDGLGEMPMAYRIAANSFGWSNFPTGAADFIEAEQFPVSMKLYNIYDFGGYLIGRLPNRPVFIDGRADIYFGDILEDVNNIQGMSYDWQEILKKRGCDFIVTSAAKKQTRLYLNSPDWTLVYADWANLDNENGVNALIFIRNRPEYARLIAKCRSDCPAAVNASKFSAWRF
ncbi:MAG: hypothetical protein ABIZ35_28850, partial [Capsulimonas sp.]|uniref:hypothetical protein n=1 Tax=Capsulimonas sp. TaxID=2494211 RepID=UPI003263DB06